MFVLEIPEIAAGLIEIKSVAREAGSRSKVAVYSETLTLILLEPVFGQNGNRIKNIVSELSEEKIDIIVWKRKQENLLQLL